MTSCAKTLQVRSVYRVLGIDIGSRNLAVCVLSWNGSSGWDGITIEYWENIDCLKEAGCVVQDSSTVPTTRVCRMIKDALLKRAPALFKRYVNEVVIEEQPLNKYNRRQGVAVTTGSIRNKMLSAAVFVTICVYLDDILKQNGRLYKTSVSMQSSKAKLLIKVDPKELLREPEKRVVKKTDYDFRKEASTVQCRRILGFLDVTPENLKARQTFEAATEKDDDLADALGHCIYALQKKFSTKQKQKRKQNSTTKTAPKKQELQDFRSRPEGFQVHAEPIELD